MQFYQLGAPVLIIVFGIIQLINAFPLSKFNGGDGSSFGANVPSHAAETAIAIGKSEANKVTNKRDLVLGDLSYSYAATDIGSSDGAHIKTVTVIKNIAIPKSDKTSLHHDFSKTDTTNDKDWIQKVNDRLKLVVKTPEFPSELFSVHLYPKEKYNGGKGNDNKGGDTASEENSKSTKTLVEMSARGEKSSHKKTKITSPENAASPQSAADDAAINRNAAREQGVAEVNSERQRGGDSDSGGGGGDINEDDSEFEVIASGIVADRESQKLNGDATGGEKSARLTDYMNYKIASAVALGKLSKLSDITIPRYKQSFVEDFSDYSMHNVKHLNDPSSFNTRNVQYKQRLPKDQSATEFGTVILSSPLQSSQTQLLTFSSSTTTTTTRRPQTYIAPRLRTTSTFNKYST